MTRLEFQDYLNDALIDSMDHDWVCSDGAAQIVRQLENEGRLQRILDVFDGPDRKADDCAAALIAIRNMLWGSPDIVRALRPLMGFAEQAVSDQCDAALKAFYGEGVEGEIAAAQSFGRRDAERRQARWP